MLCEMLAIESIADWFMFEGLPILFPLYWDVSRFRKKSFNFRPMSGAHGKPGSVVINSRIGKRYRLSKRLQMKRFVVAEDRTKYPLHTRKSKHVCLADLQKPNCFFYNHYGHLEMQQYFIYQCQEIDFREEWLQCLLRQVPIIKTFKYSINRLSNKYYWLQFNYFAI